MINLILLFPILACFILFIFKKDYLNNLMINLYALIHIFVSFAACNKIDFLPSWKTISFFEINERNLIFLIVMSVSIYSKFNTPVLRSSRRRRIICNRYIFTLARRFKTNRIHFFLFNKEIKDTFSPCHR